MQVDIARRAGLRVEGLLEGLPFSEADLRGYLGQVAWDDLVELIERVAQALGGAEGLSTAVREHWLHITPEFTAWAPLFPDVRSFLHFVLGPLTRLTYPCLEVWLIDLEDGGLEVQGTLREGCRPSELFWRENQIAGELFPVHMGLPPARVEAVMEPRRLQLRYSFLQSARAIPPPRLEIDAASREMAQALLQLHGATHGTELESPPAYLHALTQSLVPHTDCGLLAESVVAMLTDEKHCRGALMQVLNEEGNITVSRALGDVEDPAARVVRLAVGDRVVGRLKYLARDDGAHASVAALVPWLSLAVDRTRVAQMLRQQGQALEDAVMKHLQTEGLLLASLDAVDGAAFLVDSVGNVRAGNGAADRVLDGAEAGEVLPRVRAVVLRGQADPQLELIRGGPGQQVVIYRDDALQFRRRMDRALSAWSLSRRQQEVLELVARGRSNKEVGAALACAESTVELHLTQLFRKAGVGGRTELIACFWSRF